MHARRVRDGKFSFPGESPGRWNRWLIAERFAFFCDFFILFYFFATAAKILLWWAAIAKCYQWKRCINLQNKFILKTKMCISSFSHLQFKRDRRLVRAFTFWQCCTLWNLNSDAVLFSCLHWLIQGPQPHQPMPEMQTSVNVRNELTSHSHPELSLRYETVFKTSSENLQCHFAKFFKWGQVASLFWKEKLWLWLVKKMLIQITVLCFFLNKKHAAVIG